MKRVIVLVLGFFVLVGTISCTRTYNVKPQQIINCKDPVTLEKILESKGVQNMNFTITVDDISVPKTVTTEISPRIK